MAELIADLRCVLSEPDEYEQLKLLAVTLARQISNRGDAKQIALAVAMEISRRERNG